MRLTARVLAGVVLALVAAACAPLTPDQEFALEQWNRCEPLYPTTRLRHVSPDGRVMYQARRAGDLSGMGHCLVARCRPLGPCPAPDGSATED